MLPSDVKIFVAREPVDLRKSIDGLALLTRDVGVREFKRTIAPSAGALSIHREGRRQLLGESWPPKSGLRSDCRARPRAWDGRRPIRCPMLQDPASTRNFVVL